jgi:hypothetical protein
MLYNLPVRQLDEAQIAKHLSAERIARLADPPADA